MAEPFEVWIRVPAECAKAAPGIMTEEGGSLLTEEEGRILLE